MGEDIKDNDKNTLLWGLLLNGRVFGYCLIENGGDELG